MVLIVRRFKINLNYLCLLLAIMGSLVFRYLPNTGLCPVNLFLRLVNANTLFSLLFFCIQGRQNMNISDYKFPIKALVSTLINLCFNNAIFLC